MREVRSWAADAVVVAPVAAAVVLLAGDAAGASDVATILSRARGWGAVYGADLFPPALALGAIGSIASAVVAVRGLARREGAALRATDPASLARAALAAVAFCAVSSAAYLCNDVADRDRDRHHPVKRSRPI